MKQRIGIRVEFGSIEAIPSWNAAVKVDAAGRSPSLRIYP